MAVVENTVRLSCTENAALLSMITKVPGEDVRNVWERDKKAKDGGFLTLEQELTLTTALARLSRTTKNPNHITAVCVEQNPKGPELIARVAINKASPEDGQETLETILEGLGRIFPLLLKLSNDRSDLKLARNQVLTEITILCERRILDLLGSSPAAISQGSRKKRHCLSKTLHDAIAALRRIGAQTQHNPSIEQLEGLESLVKDHSECRDSQQRRCLLKTILTLCRRLIKSTSLDNLLNLLPNTSLCPDTRSSLARRIAKLGQYAGISKQLCSLALEVPALAAMRAVPVMLPPETFRSTVPASYKPDLSTALARSVAKTTGLSATLDDICAKLRTTRRKASRKFVNHVGVINREAKCHAEVQILFEYEMCPRRPAPRVVASSKSACYLCNALFRAHGTYHIPRTHGRLYRGWKLPAVDLATMRSVEAELANALERAIGDSIESLLNHRGSLKLHYPNESTLTIGSGSSLSIVTTDAVSVARAQVLKTSDPEPAQPNDNSEMAAEVQSCLDATPEPQSNDPKPWAKQMELDHDPVSFSDVDYGPAREPTSRKLSPSSSQTVLRGFGHTIITLQQGEVRTINLHPGYSPIVRSRNLCLHIERPSESMDRGGPDDGCLTLTAEWLSVKDAEKHASAESFHEARNLSTEFETNCGGNEDVVLGLGDEIIKIRRVEN